MTERFAISAFAADGGQPEPSPAIDRSASGPEGIDVVETLVRRGVTGKGSHVQTSLMEALVNFQFEVLTTHLNDGRRPPKRSNFRSAHAYLSAPYGVYPARDGYLAIAMTPIGKLADLLGIDELAPYHDQPSSWFPGSHDYSSEVLPAWQRRRAGRTPLMVARGIGRALTAARPACVVSWEYGPATLRAFAWARRQGVPLLVFSELTPWSDQALSALQRRVHRLLAPRVDGFIVAGSQGVARLRGLGVSPSVVEVALQSADLTRSVPTGPCAG